jgi:hypothetical protein
MLQFFNLPRELRDMVYMAIITWERPRPTLQDIASTGDWHETRILPRNDPECYFSRRKPPSTCANVLAASRQLNEELRQSMLCARKAGTLVARMDCIVKNERSHSFTWLSIPLVHRTTQVPNKTVGCRWVANMPVVGKLLTGPPSQQQAFDDAATSIEKLQIDIRLFEKDPSMTATLRDRKTSWAVCAALKRVCQNKMELLPTPHWPDCVVIDTLILNVVPRDGAVNECSVRKDSASAAQTDLVSQSKDADNSRAVARELVDVWNKLWSGDGYKSRHYSKLLESITRVQVRIDGVSISERELRLELERGQAERRRIAQRVGW